MSKEKDLFSTFIHRYQVGLRSYVRRLGIASDAVDDIAQETFLVAYRDLERFDTELDFGHWLRGIARNIVRNDISKLARQHRIMNEKLTHYLVNESENNNAPIVNNIDELNALNLCIKELPDKNKDLITKKYNEEANSTELSKELGMTSTAIRLSLMRIRSKLKQCIKLRLNYDY